MIDPSDSITFVAGFAFSGKDGTERRDIAVGTTVTSQSGDLANAVREYQKSVGLPDTGAKFQVTMGRLLNEPTGPKWTG